MVINSICMLCTTSSHHLIFITIKSDQQRHVTVNGIDNNDSVRVRTHTKIVLIAGQKTIQRPLLERVQYDPSAITQSLVSYFSICQLSAVHQVNQAFPNPPLPHSPRAPKPIRS